ncbi:hypothetical protein AC578_9763 [Pseudocercospora eumusae]|uniref:Uncharacterized protein n=1 Tax=Pseudocercospora eumusae TaxID=321146 RepID=A0A139H500_9PEZI|nr:hypothetical protein AC578_9763 [Pseudocercospora eumusae]
MYIQEAIQHTHVHRDEEDYQLTEEELERAKEEYAQTFAQRPHVQILLGNVLLIASRFAHLLRSACQNRGRPMLSAMKPPTRGPMAGPMNGAAENAAIETPRSSFLHRSASVPPTNVMGAENAIPSIRRHTRRVPIFGASAHGMMNTTARSSVLAYMILRPRISERGANAIGPTPNPTTKSVIIRRDTSSLTPKVMAGPVKSAVITALLNATAKQVIATTIVHHHLQALDQFLGFAGSPSTKVTSS